MKRCKYCVLTFLLSAILILGFSFLFSDASIDIHLHDTYFVIVYRHILQLFSIIFFIISEIYYLLKSFLTSPPLGLVHWLLSVQFVFIFLLKEIQSENFIPSNFYVFGTIEAMKQFYDLNSVIAISCLLFLLGQFIFMLHLLIGIIKRLK